MPRTPSHEAAERFVETLVTQYSKILYQQCSHSVNMNPQYHEDIEECLQDVFLKAMEMYGDIKDHPNVLGWLRIATRYRFSDRIRAWKRRQMVVLTNSELLDNLSGGIDADPIDGFLQKEEYAAALAILNHRMKPADLHLLTQHYTNAHSIQSIAEELGIQEIAARLRLFRARKKAQKLLEDFLL